MEKERKFKIVALVAVIIAVIGLSIAFAAMSRTLNINGSGNVDPANFDIYFTNLSQPTLKGEASVSGTPTLATKGVTISNMNVTLKKPNDSVVYTVDIKNDGDIDAEIENLVLPTFTSAQQELFDFTVVYTNGGQAVSIGDTLAKGETRNVTITFKYKDITDESLLPSTAQQISLSYQIIYKQTNNVVTTESGSIDQVSDCTPFTKKDTYAVGDVIAICNNTTGKSEDFYVISDNGTTVTALAKYNLLVGYTADFSDPNSSANDPNNYIEISSSTDGYGLQNETAKGLQEDTTSFVGGIAFEQTRDGGSYWYENNSNELKTKYGSSYPAFVYDSNSNLYSHINNYQTYINNTIGKSSATLSLLSYEQATALGCNGSDETCTSAPSWVWSTSYWTGSATQGWYGMWVIASPEHFLEIDSRSALIGIRPVITINKSEL